MCDPGITLHAGAHTRSARMSRLPPIANFAEHGGGALNEKSAASFMLSSPELAS